MGVTFEEAERTYPVGKDESITMAPTDTYGFYEGRLYRLFQGIRGGSTLSLETEWHPVKNIGQIAPTARICDE